MSKKFLIIGVGNFGRSVMRELYEADRIYKKQKTDFSCYDRFATEFSYKNDADRAR